MCVCVRVCELTVRYQRDFVQVEAEVAILVGLPGLPVVLQSRKYTFIHIALSPRHIFVCLSVVHVYCTRPRTYRVAVAVFVKVPGSVEAPLHLGCRERRLGQLTTKTQNVVAVFVKSRTDVSVFSVRLL